MVTLKSIDYTYLADILLFGSNCSILTSNFLALFYNLFGI